MSDDTPKVSIGMTVFNGEKYLKEALDSILDQTYQNFELIISDDASSDNTEKICRAYLSKDSRIRYYRNGNNIGASKNFNRVFQLSRGEYFKWAAQDDVLAPEFLSKCISILDSNPSVVLCHSRTYCINEDGEMIKPYHYKIRGNSSNPHERFCDIMSETHETWLLIFGVIRRDSLRMTPLFGNYIGEDRNLLAEIGLIGQIYVIPEYMFLRRAHSEAYTEKKHESYAEQLSWLTKTNKTNFPYIKIFIEYIRSVRRAKLNFLDRILCYMEIVKWLLSEGFLLMFFNIGDNLLRGTTFAIKLGPPFNRLLKLKGLV